MEASKRSFHKLNVEIYGWREDKAINASTERKLRAIPLLADGWLPAGPV